MRNLTCLDLEQLHIELHLAQFTIGLRTDYSQDRVRSR
jgi:hypothetical protein